jgi:hypothetical protein
MLQTKEDALFDILWKYDESWRIEQEQDGVTLINNTPSRVHGNTLEAALCMALLLYMNEEAVG